ncbi:hypothetical protein WJX82_010944, partial [Trebouxia sp. C0006]
VLCVKQLLCAEASLFTCRCGDNMRG